LTVARAFLPAAIAVDVTLPPLIEMPSLRFTS
jgi:hypothetical protein